MPIQTTTATARSTNDARPTMRPSALRPARPPVRPEIEAAQRVVVKIGTRALADAQGELRLDRLGGLVTALADLRDAGREVLVVSSGAVGLGRKLLGVPLDSDAPPVLHACAAAGQGRLVGAWEQALSRHSLVCAQVLLTEEDFDHRRRCLELRETFARLFDLGAVPLVNENDVVAHGALSSMTTRRAVFTDNDRLAALLAAELEADLLVLLTDVDGVLDADPRQAPDARRLPTLENVAELLDRLDATPGSALGRGGMRSKVEAARLAARAGAQAVVAHADDLDLVTAGADAGTWLPASTAPRARRRWIAWAAAARGTLLLDAGAVRALRERGASLLPVGVTAVEGSFAAGDVVELRDPSGAVIGRGRLGFDAATVRAWCRGLAPDGEHNCLLRRDDVFLER
ncbi:MAG: glutamate 5-kinase [Acidobacteriota bacterium]